MSYAYAEYAHSMAEFGSPLWLPDCQGTVLLRPVPGTANCDATGCYPLFSCKNPDALVADLPLLRASGAVTLVLVTDPLAGFTPAGLEQTFPDLARPYKAHYLVDLGTGTGGDWGSAHHRRNARRAGRQATLGVCANASDHLDAWCSLYDQLIARHGITGPARFSRQAFRSQLALPGAVLVQAQDTAGELLGMQLWFTSGEQAWHHLSGYSPAGYRHGGVSYALLDFALTALQQRGITVVDLGAGAGIDGDSNDGLSRFKQGWSTRTAAAWLCGAVLDPDRYAELSADCTTPFFPAYRDPRRPALSPLPEAVHAPAD